MSFQRKSIIWMTIIIIKEKMSVYEERQKQKWRKEGRVLHKFTGLVYTM